LPVGSTSNHLAGRDHLQAAARDQECSRDPHLDNAATMDVASDDHRRRKLLRTRSGQFEIDVIRIKEYSPDVQFTEKYRWNSGQFDVSIELAADEAIEDYRIGFIAPCVCREIPYDK
jgi:hypothetical protein